MDLTVGTIYRVKHSSGIIDARFETERVYTPPRRYGMYEVGRQRRTIRHFEFTNLRTGKRIVLKSTVKVKGLAARD